MVVDIKTKQAPMQFSELVLFHFVMCLLIYNNWFVFWNQGFHYHPANKISYCAERKYNCITRRFASPFQ